jgi:hypothetical protein
VLTVCKTTLHLNGWTVPDSRGDSRPLFGCILKSDDDNSPADFWNDACFIEELTKAAKHPDAVARRELQAQWAKEDEADAKARSRNAA